MTDEEIVTRLRGYWGVWDATRAGGKSLTDAAADRIEALVKDLDKAEDRERVADHMAATYLTRAERLEAALHRIQEGRYGRDAAIARTALKGNKT